MKTCIILPNQYVHNEIGDNSSMQIVDTKIPKEALNISSIKPITAISTDDVIIPKKLVDENNIYGINTLTYRDVLLSLDSELDIVTTSGVSMLESIICDNNRIIKDTVMYRECLISCLEDNTIEFLGYTATKLVDKKNEIKIAKYSNDGKYFIFSYPKHASDNYCSKEIFISGCKELFEKNYVSYIGVIHNDYTWYNISNDNFDNIINEIGEDDRKRIEIQLIRFAKIFNREEANDLLRILTKTLKLSNIEIEKVNLEDLYILV